LRSFSPLALIVVLAVTGGSLLKADSPKRAGDDWWSLQPLESVDPPGTFEDSDWAKNPIDQFIRHGLESNGLAPSPRADARTLVRRLYIDLIGLPPSPETIQRFEGDPSPRAWNRLVDDLLDSQHYGERWARHWLDVARFGESDGFEYNGPRKGLWQYRDWVIRSFNDDLPYDQFARMQISGDALMPDSLDGNAAVGFLVAGQRNPVIGAEPLMGQLNRQDALEELSAVISQTFLGLTINCARCHDHKFDPITTEEYYQFIAGLAGVTHGEREALDDNGKVVPVYTVVSSDPGTMHVYERGDVATPGKEVHPGGLRAVRDLEPSFGLDGSAPDGQRRAGLAGWITDSRNSIFLRAIVNRVWHYHFGTGIVDTPSDLGFNGGRPSHPELLDWLAIWLRDNGYSLKGLHKLIVASATYQQSSISEPTAAKIDASNRLLWRQNARRVEAEVLRDSVLEIAGELNRKRYGPGYHDVKMVSVPPANYYIPIDPIGDEFNRRTIYRWSVRGQRSALLDTFDCPDPSATAPRRTVTTTPSQALSQWNHPFMLRMSEKLAQRVQSEIVQETARQTEPVASTTDDISTRLIDRAWQLVLGRNPEADERATSKKLMDDHGLDLLCRVLFNSNEFVLID